MIQIAVIILNYKMRHHVETCVRSIIADSNALDAPTTQLIVVDNNSQDGVLEWVHEYAPEAVTVQTGGNFGFAHGVNAGLRASAARGAANYYFILNPDAYCTEPHTLKRLFDWMETHPRVGVCGPRLLNSDGSLQYSCMRFPTLTVQLLRRSSFAARGWVKRRISIFLMSNWEHNHERPVDWLMGSALFIRHDALTQVGNLDERFWMYYEDTDWSRRFWQHGWPVYYVPHVTLTHHHGRGSARVPGVLVPLIKNKLARAHLKSWMQYFWKWKHEKMKV